MLPVEKVCEKYSLNHSRMLIYGSPKVGKSTFASCFEDALFLDTQRGTKSLDIYPVYIESWEGFLDTVKEILTTKHKFKTIIIDVIDDLFKMCLEYVCKKYKMEHPSDESYGKGWELLRINFERPIIKLASSNYGIVFISHAKETEIVKKYSKITKIMPTLSGQPRLIINSIVDIIGYYGFESYKDEDDNIKERRVMVFKPSEYLDAGDRTGLLPDKILLPHSNPLKYFKKCFKQEE